MALAINIRTDRKCVHLAAINFMHRFVPKGSNLPFVSKGGNVCNRRYLAVAAPSREGLLTEPTAAAQPRRQEPLFMPHTCRSRYPPGSAQLGGKATFAEVMVIDIFEENHRFSN
jgi:hypothetical protein